MTDLTYEAIQQKSVNASDRTWVMSLLTGAILTIVLVAPIPAGSNHPFFWAFWAMVISLLVFSVLCLRLLKQAPTTRLPQLFVPPLLIGGAAVLFALGQCLPLLSSTNADYPISLAPNATMIAVLRLCSFAGLFFLLSICLSDTRRLRWFSLVLFAGVATHALTALVFLYGFGDFYPWSEKQHYLGYATGTYINRNAFASFMAMGLILGMCLRRELKGGAGRWLFGCGIGLVLFALIATQSRAAIAFGVLIALFCAAVERPAVERVKKRSAVLVGVLIAVLLVLIVSLSERSLFVVADFETRSHLWRQTLVMLGDRPLTGFGLDAFAPAFERYHKSPLPSDVSWLHPHNTYLTLWSEMGILFGSLPLIAVAVAFVSLGKKARQNWQVFPLILCAQAVIVFVALHALVDFSLEIEANVFLFLTLVAMGLSQPVFGPNRTSEVKCD